MPQTAGKEVSTRKELVTEEHLRRLLWESFQSVHQTMAAGFYGALSFPEQLIAGTLKVKQRISLAPSEWIRYFPQFPY